MCYITLSTPDCKNINQLNIIEYYLFPNFVDSLIPNELNLTNL